MRRAKPADCLKQLHSRAAGIGQHDTSNPIELGNCPSGVFRMARHVLRKRHLLLCLDLLALIDDHPQDLTLSGRQGGNGGLNLRQLLLKKEGRTSPGSLQVGRVSSEGAGIHGSLFCPAQARRGQGEREIFDKLFLAAAQDPRSVRATLKIERVAGEPFFD